MENRKVVIIGDGAVGSTIAYTLMMQDYVNEIAIEVTNDMIDISALADAVIGESYIITLTCTTNNL